MQQLSARESVPDPRTQDVDPPVKITLEVDYVTVK